MDMKKQIAQARRRSAESNMATLKTVALIPARGGSKGIIEKNIVMIAGYPMIAHSILTLKVAGVDEVWVSTEHPEIKRIALLYGARVLDRPEELAADNVSTEKVIEHFLSKVKCHVVVLVQCTSPMLRPIEIRNGLIEFMTSQSYDSMFSAVKAHDMLLWNSEVIPINYDLRNRGQRQSRRRYTLIETGGFYIFTRSIFNKTQCRLGGNIGWCEVRFWKSFQVDTKEDLAMVRKLMEKEYGCSG